MNLPPTDVLTAYGATEKPVTVRGGQGQKFRSDDLIFKPEQDEEETRRIVEF